jgi:hypothetical protein
MDGTFVSEIVLQSAKPCIVDVEGRRRLLCPDKWRDATPKQSEVEPLNIGTLTGLVDYLAADVDALTPDHFFVHIVDHGTVKLVARVEEEDKQFRRLVFLVASTDLVGAAPFLFNEYLDADRFTVGLQTGFLPTEQRKDLLTLVASIRENDVRETVDNGVSQQVKVAGGVVLVGMTKVPNPVTLRPFRTFREVEQPASLFALRLRVARDGEKPQLALFQADGGAWKLEAVQAIKAFLTGKIQVPIIG